MVGVYLGVIGLIGLAGMTWACPCAAWLAARGRRRGSAEMGTPRIPRRLVIGVPAYNEERDLPRTLESISAARQAFERPGGALPIRLIVGDDGSTDKTAETAARFGAEVVSAQKPIGKWAMLHRLMSSADDAEWIAFVDAGAVWPPDLLTALSGDLTRGDVIGLAPSYRRGSSGLFSRAVWGAERLFKRLENRAGGPVSVHGATVFYRLAALRQAFERLGEETYLNDDVIIPLTLRRLFPAKRIVYRSDVVVDDHGGAPPSERGRRRRLVLGNIQCLLTPFRGRGAPIIELIAARRFFRLFWAYWFVCLGAGVVGALWGHSPVLGLGACGLCAVIVTLPRKPRGMSAALDAGAASLRAPLDIILALRSRGIDARSAAWR